jgi:hypothetical protein
MTDKPDWKPWPESNTVRGFPLLGRWPYSYGTGNFKRSLENQRKIAEGWKPYVQLDFAAAERAWAELQAAVRADIARERGVPVEKVRFVYGEGACCDEVTVEIDP